MLDTVADISGLFLLFYLLLSFLSINYIKNFETLINGNGHTHTHTNIKQGNSGN